MNSFPPEIVLVSDAAVKQLGWMLIHSSWQFLLIAAAAWVWLKVTSSAAAQLRYLGLVSILALMMAAPLATYAVLDALPPTVVVAEETPIRAPAPVMETPQSAVQQPVNLSPAPLDPPQIAEMLPAAAPPLIEIPPIPEPAPQPEFTWAEIPAILQPWFGEIVTLWCLGVAIFSLRPLIGWFRVRRLKTVGVAAVPTAVQQLLNRTADRLGLRRTVEILQSTLVQGPVVVGYFRPVILLPLSVITGLPANQLEAILAHELAHIRRHDYVVNFGQIVFETLFFYHPAVWWLSRRIRIERENCCDDLVVAAFDNRADYGRALLAIAELPQPATSLAMGTNDGSLSSRIGRIIKFKADDSPADRGTTNLRGRFSAAALSLVSITLIYACQLNFSAAESPDGEADNVAHEEQEKDKKRDKNETKDWAWDASVKLSGRIVIEDGSPADVKGDISIYSENKDNASERGSNDRLKSDRFSYKMPPGETWVICYPEEYAPAWIGPFQTKAGEERDDLKIVLGPGLTRPVELVDEVGQPVPHAQVEVGPAIRDDQARRSLKFTTDAQGRLNLDKLADTRYQFTIRASGFQPLRTEPLKIGSQEKLRFQLERSYPCTGIVRNADGTPAAGAQFLLIKELTESGQSYTKSFNLGDEFEEVMAETDHQGRFTLDRFADGSRHLMLVQTQDGARAVVHDLQAGQNDLEIVMPSRRDLRVNLSADYMEQLHGFQKQKIFIEFPFPDHQNPTHASFSYEKLHGSAEIETTADGGEAIFRGVPVDLGAEKTGQRIVIQPGNAYGKSQAVRMNRNGETVVNFTWPLQPPKFPSAQVSRTPASRSDKHAVWVHSGEFVHFVLYYDGFLQTGLNYSERDLENSPNCPWNFNGHINALSGRIEMKDDAGRRKIDWKQKRRFDLDFYYYPPDFTKLALDGEEYDFSEGRVFVLNQQGKPTQLSLDLPRAEELKDIDAFSKRLSLQDNVQSDQEEAVEPVGAKIRWGNRFKGGLRLGIRPSPTAKHDTQFRQGDWLRYEVWVKNENDETVYIRSDPGERLLPTFKEGVINIVGSGMLQWSDMVEESKQPSLTLKPRESGRLLRALPAPIHDPTQPHDLGSITLNLKPGKYPLFAEMNLSFLSGGQFDPARKDVQSSEVAAPVIEIEVLPAARLQIRPAQERNEAITQDILEKSKNLEVIEWQESPKNKRELVINHLDETLIDEDDLVSAEVQANDANGRASVLLSLTPAAGKRLVRETKRLAEQPQKPLLAILLDGKVLVAPKLHSAIGQKVLISGNFTLEEAKQLADKIKALIKPPPPAPMEKDISWGEPVNGLQLGIELDKPKAAYAVGDVVSFRLNLRNVSKQEIQVERFQTTWPTWAPKVFAADGKPLPVLPPLQNPWGKIFDLTLAPGETYFIGNKFLTPQPSDWQGEIHRTVLLTDGGRVRLHLNNTFHFDVIGSTTDRGINQLNTGFIDFTVAAIEATPNGQPQDAENVVEARRHVMRLLGHRVIAQSQQVDLRSGAAVGVPGENDWISECAELTELEVAELGAAARNHPDVAYRGIAVKALGHVKQGDPAMALAQCLRDSQPDVRASAARSLGELRHEASIPRLTKLLLSDSAKGVRGTAAWALGIIGKNKGTLALTKALRSDEETSVKQAAALALGWITDPAALPALQAALEDPQSDKQLKEYAAAAIKNIEDPDDWGLGLKHGQPNPDERPAPEGEDEAKAKPLDPLEGLIQQVKRNERLYDDIRFSLVSDYEEFEFNFDEKPQTTIKKEMSIVKRGGRFRINETAKLHRSLRLWNVGVDAGQPVRKNKLNFLGKYAKTTLFDGKTARIYQRSLESPREIGGKGLASKTGIVSDKHPGLTNLSRPHMLFYEAGFPKVLLSTYLQGHKAVFATPNPDFQFLGPIKAEWLGEEEFHGHDCIKVRINQMYKKGKRSSGSELWLAKDRNLIPVRILSYTDKWSSKIPIAESIVEEWQELRPGVWFPKSVQVDRYHSQTVRDQGKQVLTWRNHYSLKDVVLNPPEVTDETFTELVFPPGTKIREEKDGARREYVIE